MSSSNRAIAALGGLQAKIRAAIARGTALYVRQSSVRQALRNTGSADAQRHQLRYLELYGVDPSQVTVIDARGESARKGADRPDFQRLLRMVESREVGLVAVTHYDRISRNETDSTRIRDALKDAGGILLVGMNFYDVSDPTHEMLLGIQGVLAQFDNQQRALRICMSRAAKALRLEYPVPLPSGLVWASPDDAEYRSRLAAAGLEYHLENLKRHKAVFTREGRRYYVLPYPDAAVYRSVVLRFEWLYRFGSISNVIERMNSDEWPMPGRVPIGGSRLFDPARPPTWIGLTEREDGKTPFIRGGLYKWFKSPALYGTYAFQSDRLTSYGAEGDLGAAVNVADAFPSFRPHGDLARTREVLRSAPKTWKRGTFDGLRTNALPYVRCAGLRLDGTRCNARMSAKFQTNGRGVYASVTCRERHGHTAQCPVGVVDEAVRDVVLEAYTPEVIDQMLASVAVQQDGDTSRARLLARQAEELTRKIEYHVTQQERAAATGNQDEERFWDERRTAALTERRQTEVERVRITERAALVATRSRQELEQLKSVARDLPRLLQMARGMEGGERAILKSLMRDVHVRSVGHGTYWVIVTLPSGARSERVVFSTGLICTQPQRAYAAAALHAWRDPVQREAARTESEAVAAGLVEHLIVPGHRTGWRTWDPERVWAAAYAHHVDPGTPRPGGLTVPEISCQVGETHALVLLAALAGRLGPAAAREGAFLVAPTGRELDQAFPDHARRKVAEQEGWPVEDTVTLLELAMELELDYRRMRHALRPDGSSARDLAGRWYVRRSEVLRQPQEAYDIGREASAAGITVPMEHCLRVTEAHRLIPWLDWKPLTIHCPTLRPGKGAAGSRTAYIWLGPEQLQALRNNSNGRTWGVSSHAVAKAGKRKRVS